MPKNGENMTSCFDFTTNFHAIFSIKLLSNKLTLCSHHATVSWCFQIFSTIFFIIIIESALNILLQIYNSLSPILFLFIKVPRRQGGLACVFTSGCRRWLSCEVSTYDVIEFSGVSSKSRRSHQHKLNVRCVDFAFGSKNMNFISFAHCLTPVQHKHQ